MITPGFPKDEEDTECIPALQIFMEALALKDQFRITVIALEYPQQEKHYQWNGVPVIALAEKRLTSWKLFRTLVEVNTKRKIDLFHIFWFQRHAWVANIFASLNRIPLILTLMGQDAIQDGLWWKTLINRRFIFVTLTDYQDQRFKSKSGCRKTTLIPWGIEKFTIRTDSKRAIDILGAGWFTMVKNYSLFLEVICLVNQQFPLSRVVLAGKGEQERLIHELSRQKGLDKIIQFTGLERRKDVLEQMAKSKIFLHTSSYESFSMVLAEAIASGCKVVSTPVGIAFSDSSIETGTLASELSGAVVKALKASDSFNPDEKYLVESTVTQYVALYTRLLKEVIISD